MAFIDDLEEGNGSEDRVLRIIRKRYSQAKRIEGKHSPYDIMLPELGYTVEVKGDYVIPVDTYRTFATTYYHYK